MGEVAYSRNLSAEEYPGGFVMLRAIAFRLRLQLLEDGTSGEGDGRVSPSKCGLTGKRGG